MVGGKSLETLFPDCARVVSHTTFGKLVFPDAGPVRYIDQRTRFVRAPLRNAAITFRILLIELASATGRKRNDPQFGIIGHRERHDINDDAPRQRMIVRPNALSQRQYVMTRPPLGELGTDRVEAFNQLDKIAVAGMTPVIGAEYGDHVPGPRRPVYDQGAQH